MMTIYQKFAGLTSANSVERAIRRYQVSLSRALKPDKVYFERGHLEFMKVKYSDHLNTEQLNTGLFSVRYSNG